MLPPERFYVSLDAALDALARRSQFNVIDMQTGWKVDLIILKARPFSRREFRRRVPIEILGTVVPVATVEDTIVGKLEWSKLAGGSARQLEDVEALAALAGARLDEPYVEAAATELATMPSMM